MRAQTCGGHKLAEEARSPSARMARERRAQLLHRRELQAQQLAQRSSRLRIVHMRRKVQKRSCRRGDRDALVEGGLALERGGAEHEHGAEPAWPAAAGPGHGLEGTLER